MKPTLLPATLFMLSLVAGCATRTATTAGPPASQAIASGLPRTVVENWVKPESGWLYVLDVHPEPNDFEGRIWLVDPVSAKVMGSIRAGSNPDFALSPDGSRLYVASETIGQSSELAVIDTARGTVVDRDTVDNRVVANGIPSFSSMAVSRDGLAVRVLVNSIVSPDTDGFQLAAFATRTGKFAPGRVYLGNCGYGQFISNPIAYQVDFFCPTTNRIRLFRMDPISREFNNAYVVLPWVRRIGVAEAFPAPDGQEITIIRGDGAVFEMNVATSRFIGTPVHGDRQGQILPAAWPISTDGHRIYLGYNRFPDPRFYLNYDRYGELHSSSAIADEFRVFDTSTWQMLGSIRTRTPFWSAVAGNDGRLLYALAPKNHSLLVIDTATMRETGAIPVGGTPALALVAP